MKAARLVKHAVERTVERFVTRRPRAVPQVLRHRAIDHVRARSHHAELAVEGGGAVAVDVVLQGPRRLSCLAGPAVERSDRAAPRLRQAKGCDGETDEHFKADDRRHNGQVHDPQVLID